MATTTQTEVLPLWRSGAEIPLRAPVGSSGDAAPAPRDTMTGRIPLVLPRPSVPTAGLRPKAFSGELYWLQAGAFASETVNASNRGEIEKTGDQYIPMLR